MRLRRRPLIWTLAVLSAVVGGLWVGFEGAGASVVGWAEAQWDLAHDRPAVKITGYFGYGGRVEDLAREELARVGVNWEHYGCMMTPNLYHYTSSYTETVGRALARLHGRDVVKSAFMHAKEQAKAEWADEKALEPCPDDATP